MVGVEVSDGAPVVVVGEEEPDRRLASIVSRLGVDMVDDERDVEGVEGCPVICHYYHHQHQQHHSIIMTYGYHHIHCRYSHY